jgi:stringent starvation protein B
MVPPWLKKQPQLVLQIGLNMAVKIPDLDIGEQAISCTLSFSRRPHFCYVPWHAVYALVGEDGRGMVWPEDIPPEVASQNPTPAKRTPALRSVPPPGPAGESRLSAVPPAPGSLAQLGLALRAGGELESSDEDEDTNPEDVIAAPDSNSGAADKLPAHTSVRPEPARSGSVRPAASGRSPSERPYLRLIK